MGIRLEYQPSPGAFGIAAYKAGRGRARERYQNAMQRRQEQTLGFQRQLGLEGIRQAGRLEYQRRDLADRAGYRGFLAQRDTERHRLAREGDTNELLVDRYESLKGQLDEILKEGGGHIPNTPEGRAFWNNVKKYQEDEEKALATGDWDSIQVRREAIPKMLKLIQAFNRDKHLVKPQDRPNQEFERDGWVWRNTPDGPMRVRPINEQDEIGKGIIPWTPVPGGPTYHMQPRYDRKGNRIPGYDPVDAGGTQEYEKAAKAYDDQVWKIAISLLGNSPTTEEYAKAFSDAEEILKLRGIEKPTPAAGQGAPGASQPDWRGSAIPGPTGPGVPTEGAPGTGNFGGRGLGAPAGPDSPLPQPPAAGGGGPQQPVAQSDAKAQWDDYYRREEAQYKGPGMRTSLNVIPPDVPRPEGYVKPPTERQAKWDEGIAAAVDRATRRRRGETVDPDVDSGIDPGHAGPRERRIASSIAADEAIAAAIDRAHRRRNGETVDPDVDSGIDPGHSGPREKRVADSIAFDESVAAAADRARSSGSGQPAEGGEEGGGGHYPADAEGLSEWARGRAAQAGQPGPGAPAALPNPAAPQPVTPGPQPQAPPALREPTPYERHREARTERREATLRFLAKKKEGPVQITGRPIAPPKGKAAENFTKKGHEYVPVLNSKGKKTGRNAWRPKPPEQTITRRNGKTVTGRVYREGDSYTIVKPNGKTVTLDAKQVQSIGSDQPAAAAGATGDFFGAAPAREFPAEVDAAGPGASAATQGQPEDWVGAGAAAEPSAAQNMTAPQQTVEPAQPEEPTTQQATGGISPATDGQSAMKSFNDPMRVKEDPHHAWITGKIKTDEQFQAADGRLYSIDATGRMSAIPTWKLPNAASTPTAAAPQPQPQQSAQTKRRISPDGKWEWNGTKWVPTGGS